MKVGNAGPTGPVRSTQAPDRARAAAAYGRAAPVLGISDAASVMGVPEAEMTPKVRDAIMTLMAEVDKLRQDLEQSRGRISELEQLADTDALLPVLNRRGFVRELSRMLSTAERYGHEVSLVYMDLDDFKEINDAYGHAAGDAALMHIGALLK